MKKLKGNDTSVASVIGALMVVMMVTFALTLVVTKYVPTWMKDNEASHMKEVGNQFANLKYIIDAQILNTQTLESNEGDVIMYTPISLGCKGVPIFASGTTGTIEINSFDNNFTISNSSMVFAKCMGNIRFSSNNRYFTGQDYVYENGAVIINQSKGHSMKVGPQFTIKNESNGFHLSLIFIYIIGEEVTLSGTDSEEICTQILSYQGKTYYWSNESITFDITTEYRFSWEDYINSTFTEVGLIYNSDYQIQNHVGRIEINIYNIKTLNIGVAGVNTKLFLG